MGFFNKLKKNKTERIEDHYQVRYVFKDEFDPEKNKLIGEIYDQVVEDQTQRGTLTLSDTAPFATFSMIEDLFSALKSFIEKEAKPIEFSDFAIWAYDKDKKWNLGKPGSDDGNPYEFITLEKFELNFEYQNLTKVIFESIFNDPENEDYPFEEKLDICKEIAETYRLSTNCDDRSIARFPGIEEVEKGNVTLDVPKYTLVRSSAEDGTMQYDPLTHTFSSNQNNLQNANNDSVNTKKMDKQSHEQNTIIKQESQTKKENTPSAKHIQKNKIPTGKRTQHQQIQQQVNQEEQFAKTQGQIEIPQFEISKDLSKVEAGQDGYVEYKLNEYRKDLNNRLKLIGNKINDENIKTILKRHDSYIKNTQKVVNQYIKDHKSILRSLEDKVQEEMLQKSNSEIKALKTRLSETEKQELSIAKQEYDTKVTNIKQKIQTDIASQTNEIRHKYESLAYQKYNTEYDRKKKEIEQGKQKVWQDNSRKADIKLREDIAQLRMNSAETLDNFFRSLQDRLDEYQNKVLTEHLNAKKIIVAQQQAENESKKVAAPYTEIEQKNEILANLNAQLAAITAERDSLVKHNQDLKVDNETLRRRNDQLADQQTQQAELSAKQVRDLEQAKVNTTPDYFQQWFQIEMAKQLQNDPQQQKETTKVEKIEDSKVTQLSNSLKSARKLAISSLILLLLGGLVSGFVVYNNNQANNEALAAMDKRLTSQINKNKKTKHTSFTQDEINQKANNALHSNDLNALNKYSTEPYYELDKAIIQNNKDKVAEIVSKMDQNNLKFNDKYRSSMTENLLKQANQNDLASKVQVQNK